MTAQTIDRLKQLHLAAFVVCMVVWTIGLLVPIPEAAQSAIGPADLLFWISKSLHVSVYAFLAILGGTTALLGQPRYRVYLGLIAHGGVTEILQTFVGRYGCVRDVLIDTLGIAIGASVVFLGGVALRSVQKAEIG